MNTIWVFGCSFSSGYLEVPVEKSYGSILANKLNFNIKNLSRPGNCNDKIYYDLMNNINDINDNDIIIYQFSSFNRIGFFKNNNDNSYFSSAGVPELGVEYKQKEVNFSEYNLNDLTKMLDFILTWQPLRFKFNLKNTINILNYLQINKNIKYKIIFLTNECKYFSDNILKLPIDIDDTNLSLNDFLDYNKLTIGHEYPNKYIYGDTHPGFSGHEKISELLYNNFKTIKK